MESQQDDRNTTEQFEAWALCVRQERLWPVLDEWEAPTVSSGFNRRLYARIEHEENAGWLPRLWRRADGKRWQQAFSLATACVVIVAMLLLNVQPAPPAHPKSRMDPVDIKQVERALDDLEMLQQLNPAVKVEIPVAEKSL